MTKATILRHCSTNLACRLAEWRPAIGPSIVVLFCLSGLSPQLNLNRKLECRWLNTTAYTHIQICLPTCATICRTGWHFAVFWHTNTLTDSKETKNGLHVCLFAPFSCVRKWSFFVFFLLIFWALFFVLFIDRLFWQCFFFVHSELPTTRTTTGTVITTFSV